MANPMYKGGTGEKWNLSIGFGTCLPVCCQLLVGVLLVVCDKIEVVFLHCTGNQQQLIRVLHWWPCYWPDIEFCPVPVSVFDFGCPLAGCGVNSHGVMIRRLYCVFCESTKMAVMLYLCSILSSLGHDIIIFPLVVGWLYPKRHKRTRIEEEGQYISNCQQEHIIIIDVVSARMDMWWLWLMCC